MSAKALRSTPVTIHDEYDEMVLVKRRRLSAECFVL
jgi:hypothetical protein